MKFSELNEEDIAKIKEVYTSYPRGSKEKAYSELAEMYNIKSRTVRTWLQLLGITNVPRERTKSYVVRILPTIIKEKSPAKILVLDIETAPLLAYVWGVWNINIGHNMQMVQKHWFMLTWSAKWLFDDKIFSDKLTPEEIFAQDDSRITKSIWELVNEADVVIAHNGIKFDMKRLNTRFLRHRLPPPMPYQIIDTLVHVKKQFALSSNRLAEIGKFLGLGEKLDTEEKSNSFHTYR